MSIQYDSVTKLKITKIVPDAAWIAPAVVNTFQSIYDFPQSGRNTDPLQEINYFYLYRGFYWYNRGFLYVKADYSYTTEGDPC